MEANVTPNDHKDQEEYILLDLDGVSGQLDIPPNAKYVLSGLDTLNPVLIIDDKLKLTFIVPMYPFDTDRIWIYKGIGKLFCANESVGEYEETIGTSIVFTEEDTPVVHEETGPSEVNLFSGTRIIDSSQPPTKQVKPLCQLHKVLKFRVSPVSEIQAVTTEQAK